MVGLAGLVVTDSGANPLQDNAGMDRFSATAVATIAATALSFVASRYWTFRHRDRSGSRRESVRYVTLYGAGLAHPASFVALTVGVLGRPGMPSDEAALVIGVGLGAAFRFWCCREWVWPRQRPVTMAARTVMD